MKISKRILATTFLIPLLANGALAQIVPGGGGIVPGYSNLTASRLMVTNANGKPSTDNVTATEAGFLSGVTSNIQAQLNAKQGALTLTTIGSSGVSTLIGNTLNIPNYTGGGGGGISYGGNVTTGHDNESLYIDNTGDLASDSGFTRNHSGDDVTTINSTDSANNWTYTLKVGTTGGTGDSFFGSSQAGVGGSHFYTDLGNAAMDTFDNSGNFRNLQLTPTDIIVNNNYHFPLDIDAKNIPFFDDTKHLITDGTIQHSPGDNKLLYVQGANNITLLSIAGSLTAGLTDGAQAGNAVQFFAADSGTNQTAGIDLVDTGTGAVRLGLLNGTAGTEFFTPTTFGTGGSNYVWVDPAGDGNVSEEDITTLIPSPPIYPTNQIVYGDGSTPGGTTDNNFTRSTSLNDFYLTDGSAPMIYADATNNVYGIGAGSLTNHIGNGTFLAMDDAAQTAGVYGLYSTFFNNSLIFANFIDGSVKIGPGSGGNGTSLFLNDSNSTIAGTVLTGTGSTLINEEPGDATIEVQDSNTGITSNAVFNSSSGMNLTAHDNSGNSTTVVLNGTGSSTYSSTHGTTISAGTTLSTSSAGNTTITSGANMNLVDISGQVIIGNTAINDIKINNSTNISKYDGITESTSNTVFTGTGLNDFSANGNFTGNTTANYSATIDQINTDFVLLAGISGTPTVGMSVNDLTSGATGTIYRVGLPNSLWITPLTGTINNGDNLDLNSGAVTGTISLLALYDTYTWTDGTTTIPQEPMNTSDALQGINAGFGSSTGHTLNDNWAFTVTASQFPYMQYVGTTNVLNTGDATLAFNHTVQSIQDKNQTISNNTFYNSSDATTYFSHYTSDGVTGQTCEGDCDNVNHGTKLSINDAGQFAALGNLTSGGTTKILVDTATPLIQAQTIGQFSAGDKAGAANNTSETIDDAIQDVTFNTKTASIGETDNLEPNVTAQYFLGSYVTPDALTLPGSFHVVTNSSTGDAAYVGAGDLSALGLSTEAVQIGHKTTAGDSATMTADNSAGVPILYNQAYLAGNQAGGSTISQTPTGFSEIFGTNNTSLRVDATAQTMIYNSNDPWMMLDGANRRYELGDYTFDWFGTSIDINDDVASKSITLRATTTVVNSGILFNQQTITGTASINDNAYYIDCGTNSSICTPLLPAIINSGRTIVISDATYNASVNNIIITPNGADTINGSNSPFIINTNGGSIIIHSDGIFANNWIIN